jgi:glycosyltransferase involved in cell wall biosynthesis
MKVLIVAPQPFYQERGTPIAVKLLAENLCELGHEVDLLVYHAGANVTVPGLRLIRAARPWGVRRVPIGPSWQKLPCDAMLIVKMIGLLRRNRYDVVHAVEEAVFPAALLVGLGNALGRRRHDGGRDGGREGGRDGSRDDASDRDRTRTKLVYDMDSSLSDQLIEKWARLEALRGMFRGVERLAVRRAAVVLAVCEDLAAKVRPWGDAERVYVLPDVPLAGAEVAENVEALRAATIPDAAAFKREIARAAAGAVVVGATFGATARAPAALPEKTSADDGAEPVLALYVGNLERYQGLDLLLDAIACLPRDLPLYTAVIGGDMASVKRYRTLANELDIAGRVRFFGARPVRNLNAYLAQADILLSPRILGDNTPMKVYSYMQSGKAIVATDIRSHTQALDAETALLVPADPPAFAAGLERLTRDAELRERLGAAARAKAEREYSLPVYRRKLASAYARLAEA